MKANRTAAHAGLGRRLHRTRDALVFCVALACAWAAANIDDPAPAVAIATTH